MKSPSPSGGQKIPLTNSPAERDTGSLKLEDGSRVGVVGGGPAGSFFSYFLLQMADRIGLTLQVDIYEPRDFTKTGPAGCNMCGGIISETLVQNLAVEGINLPSTVVQRGIDSYLLHTDVGSVRIPTPLQEKRIGAVHRGCGPRDVKEAQWRGFDDYLQELAVSKGAQMVRRRVDGFRWEDGRPTLLTPRTPPKTYDLLVMAVGVNTTVLGLLEELGLAYKAPQRTKAYIGEFSLGRDVIGKYLGSSMHLFLLDVPRLECAALIPKGEHMTFCLLGDAIDLPLVQSFLHTPEVRQCLPPNWEPHLDYCHCAPRINIKEAVQPYADRLVFIGDCGVTRLYKDGIGAAYRTAKAAALTAVFHGISAGDFRRHYEPTCKRIALDNKFGKLIFEITDLIKKLRPARRGVWRMVSKEQQNRTTPRMSTVLWDTFTGSAPYRDVFLRTLHPFFWSRFLWEIAVGAWRSRRRP